MTTDRIPRRTDQTPRRWRRRPLDPESTLADCRRELSVIRDRWATDA